MVKLGEGVPFDVVSELGRGAHGAVYLVRHRATGEELALKTIATTDPADVARLKREFRAVADLSHPNLVVLHELTVLPSAAFFTMDAVAGVTLTTWIAREVLHADGGRGDAGAPPDWDKLIDALTQAFSALAFLHERGRLHRDIKPGNVLVSGDGRLTLLDFGLSSDRWHEPQDDADMLVGTALYMAPEQVRGERQTPAADYYAFGAVLFEALTGEPPFTGSASFVLTRKLQEPAPKLAGRLPSAPPWLGLLVDGLLEHEPARRPDLERVRALLAAGRRAALPGTAASASARRGEPGALIGREAVMTSLFAACAPDVRSDEPSTVGPTRGSSRFVVLHGAPGSGRTRTLAELAGRLRRTRRDVLVLEGGCDRRELVSFNAFDAILDQCVGQLLARDTSILRASSGESGATPAPLRPEHGESLALAFPSLARLAGWVAPEPERVPRDPRVWLDALVHALRELFLVVADGRLLVVVLDDIEAADDDSLRLLRHVFGADNEVSLRLVLSARAPQPELASFCAAAGIAYDEVALDALDDEAVATLVRRHAGDDADVRQAVRIAAGSPRLAELLGAALARGESLDGLDHERAILERLAAAMAPEARAILETVALAGTPLSRSELAALAGTTAARVSLQVGTLCHLGLLARTHVAGIGGGLELVHDELAAVLDARLAPGSRVAACERVAEALARREVVPTLARAELLKRAGREYDARKEALAAAAHAEARLAYAHAAALYAWVFAHEPDVVQRGRLAYARAEVLFKGGNCSAAAAAYEVAAELSEGETAAGLRVRGASAWLVAGRMAEGLRLFLPELAAHGIAYPRTQGAALRSALRGFIRLAFTRPERVVVLRADEVPPSGTSEADLCWEIAKGIANVMPIVGTDFMLRSLRFAVRERRARSVARSLAFLGAGLALQGGRLGRRGEAFLGRAESIARTEDDSYVRGIALVFQALAHLGSTARWDAAERLAEEGLERLTRQSGVNWECAIAEGVVLKALSMTGDVTRMRRRASAWLDGAVRRDDRFERVVATQFMAMADLATHGPVRAEERMRVALASWDDVGYSLQHFAADVVACDGHLMEGRAGEAFARIEAAWPSIVKANLLRVSISRIDAMAARASVGIAALASGEPAAARVVKRALKQLAKEERPDARHLAAWLGVCAARARAGDAEAGERAGLAPALRLARDGFATLGMRARVAAIDICASALVGDEGGVRRGLAALRTLGYARPESALRALAPGWPDVAPTPTPR